MYPDGTCTEYLSKVVALLKVHDLPSQTLKMKQNKNYYFNSNLSKLKSSDQFSCIWKKRKIKEKYHQVLCFIVFTIMLFKLGFNNQ